jgi:HK97 family phage major capsid protein
MDEQMEDNRVRFTFSSEMPVDRTMGEEVLDHSDGAVRLDRLNDGAPVLFNHDANNYVGVVERAYVEDRRGYAIARYGSSEFAQQIKRDVEAGIIRNISVGYRILKMGDHSKNLYRVAEWEPLELSFVTIPADPTVGVGRSLVDEEPPIQPITEETMENPQSTPATVPDNTVENERERIRTISALGTRFNRSDLAEQLIESGRSVDESRAAFLDVLNVQQKPINQQSGEVDMNQNERRQYSLIRAINACVSGNWSDAGLERECSTELERKIGRGTNGFFVPHSILSTRTQSTASYSTGGALVATQLASESFVDLLRNNAILAQLNPTILTGLVGNVDIPRQTGATTSYWVGENTDVTASNATFDTLSLTPKQVGNRTTITRLALAQTTPDIEQILRNDMAQQLALAIDSAAINGTGSSSQPLGLLNAAGVTTVDLPSDTNGAAIGASNTGLDVFYDLEKAVDIANALNGTLFYVTNPKVVGAIKKIKIGTNYGQSIWSQNLLDTTGAVPMVVNGYPVARSNQVPSTLTKGSSSAASALIFGNFSDLIMAMWGGLEVLPNPYGTGYNAGNIELRALQTIDIAVRRPASFAKCASILTP